MEWPGQQQQRQRAAGAPQVRVHFTVGHRHEVALFRTDTPSVHLKELFRSAAEAGPRDILKLYDVQGALMNISADLPANTPNTAYALHVVAAHPNGPLPDDLGAELRALDARVAHLERQLRLDFDTLPPAVQDLRDQVEGFRHKLETTEALSWLGFYKQLPEPLSTDECRRLQYRRKSDTIKKRVKENFLNICDSSVSDAVQQWLRMPTFDSRQWEDEELLLLLQQMFFDLDLCSKFAIDIRTLRNFLYEVYKNYNEVPFHNFRHCFCVAQMSDTCCPSINTINYLVKHLWDNHAYRDIYRDIVAFSGCRPISVYTFLGRNNELNSLKMYAIACYVDLPSKIGDLETLILITSSICHDLDHPGYNNIYQINAKTELALRYNDISPLENHHCSVAFRILENDDCNIFKSFSYEMFKQVREGMIRCILATDMARHNEILAQFKDITPCFDYNNKSHVNLLCMVLIKVADISNEARPMDVAEPWLDRLLQEFFKQSDAEKLEGLPVTPFMDRDKITKPSSQCSFIGFVLLPLFEALGELFTELQDLIVQPVRDALDYYRRLNEATKEERMHRKSVVAELFDHASSLPAANSPDSSGSASVPKSGSNHSVRSKKSITFAQNRSRSRSTDEDLEVGGNVDPAPVSDEESTNLAEVAEDNESGDSETATEVEVSEKTLKFKISTEGSLMSGRKSYPGSRKGSREKAQQLNCVEVARAVQGEKERRRLVAGAHSFDQRILAGKKLSFDTADLLDEHSRRYFKQFCRRISHDEYNVNESDALVDRLRHKRNSTQEPTSLVQASPTPTPPPPPPPSTLISHNNTCKHLDKISVQHDEDKDLDEQETNNVPPTTDNNTVDKSAPISPNGNRSLLARLRHFTDRLGLGLDKDSSRLRNLLSLKNNNGTLRCRTTARRDDTQPCCRGTDLDDEKRASTLPKTNRSGSTATKKGWKQRLSLGKERPAKSLDTLPASSPARAPTPTPGSVSSIPATCEPRLETAVQLM